MSLVLYTFHDHHYDAVTSLSWAPGDRYRTSDTGLQTRLNGFPEKIQNINAIIEQTIDAPVEMRVTATHVEWRAVDGSGVWQQLYALSDFKGDKGDTGTITLGTITTGAPGSDVVITNRGTLTDAILDIRIPQGDKGDKGDAATVEIGNVANGATPNVTNSGTPYAAVLDFVLQRGAAATVALGAVATVAAGQPAAVRNVGDEFDAQFEFDIPQGIPGKAATIEIGSVTSGETASVTNSGTVNAAVLDIVLEKGDPGSISIDSVTTVPYEDPATITNIGTSKDAVLQIEIPRGAPGLGVPAGGATGQYLRKVSEANNDTEWADAVVGNFIDSADTPASYSTNAGLFVAVAATEDGLSFIVPQISDIEGLDTDLDALWDGKSDVGHTHTIADITDFDAVALPVSTAVQDALDAKANIRQERSAFTGNRTIAADDIGKMLAGTGSAAQNITVEPQSSVATGAGFLVMIRQEADGQIALVEGAGVIIRSKDDSLALAGVGSEAYLVNQDGGDEWWLTGDLA